METQRRGGCPILCGAGVAEQRVGTNEGDLAEEEGFEPPGRLSSASRFQGGPVKPLRHSSAAIMPNSWEKVYAAHGEQKKWRRHSCLRWQTRMSAPLPKGVWPR